MLINKKIYIKRVTHTSSYQLFWYHDALYLINIREARGGIGPNLGQEAWSTLPDCFVSSSNYQHIQPCELNLTWCEILVSDKILRTICCIHQAKSGMTSAKSRITSGCKGSTCCRMTSWYIRLCFLSDIYHSRYNGVIKIS